jgi:hypothetical protein
MPAAEEFLLPHPESNAVPKNNTVAVQANISALRVGTAKTLAGRAFINLPNNTSSFLLIFESIMDSNTYAVQKYSVSRLLTVAAQKL